MNWNGLPNAFWSDNHRLLFNKDSRGMIDLPDEYVQCVVTSPPYWGLRKYSGNQDLVWGGDPNCGHTETTDDNTKHGNLRFRGEHSIVGNEKNKEIHPVHSWGEEIERTGGAGNKTPSGFQQLSRAGVLGSLSQTKWSGSTSGSFCSLCGAWKGQYGLEPTPELYVQHTIEIFREVRRVLRKDGVVFLNIGDSYAGSGKGQNADGTPGKSGKLQKSNKGTQVGGIPVSRFDKWNSDTANSIQVSHDTPKASYNGLKPKDLCLIPFHLAIALQQDGWWVRSVIIWNKPNPMPESVTDRPTESHEYILLLTKSAHYYWDAEAVREPHSRDWGLEGWAQHGYKQTKNYNGSGSRGLIAPERGEPSIQNPAGRNLRSVWSFPTQPYPEAHFATYPEKLVEICVKAATPEVGCCSKCGKPWVRITETIRMGKPREQTKWAPGSEYGPSNKSTLQGCATGAGSKSETLGWQPQCNCNADKVPSIVLDPFVGSGTTLKVAAELNRRAIGYELSEEYCKLAVERNKQGVMI